jgi:sigma-B regulation protein RsbU (phosphoserine phosphatase)
LESLLESAKLLNATLQLDDLLRHLLRTVMGRLLVMRAAIALESGGRFSLELARGLPRLKRGAPLSDEQARELGLPLVFPIGDPAAPTGFLALAAPPRPLDEGEREFVAALLGLAATGIANARAHLQVIHSNQELRALLDLSRGLSSTIEPEEVAQMLLLTLAGRWGVRKHALATWKDGQPSICRYRGLDSFDPAPFRELREPHCDEQGLRLPLIAGDKTIGVVACGPRLGGLTYSAADVEFGAGLAAQAAVALENAWHFRDTLVKQQFEKELSLAASIQADLFPKQLPTLAHTDLAARNRQARQVGGDYYDALPVDQSGPAEPYLFCVADISGKGLSAALLMANIQATLRALLTPTIPLTLLAARINDLLHASTPDNKYATAFFLRYDPLTGACEYVNGGHNDAVLLRPSGEVELLSTTGMPVGLFPRRLFESAAFQVNAGDLLFIYSDGVTDAINPAEEDFGADRMIDCLRQADHLPPSEVIDHLFARIDAFAGLAPQADDITMMVIKRRHEV